jgi:hypothetical protein
MARYKTRQMQRKLCISISLVIGLAVNLGACTSDDTSDTGPGETTRFAVAVTNLAPIYPFFASGIFSTPDGASEPGPLLPGGSYSVQFYAPPGSRVSFATMFVPSNDLFLAPLGPGIALFDDQGQPLSGDVTDQVWIWNAGTEADEPLGLGDNQASTQTGPDVGDADPDTNVRLANDPNLPPVSALIGATLSAGPGNQFTLTLENRSDDQTLLRADNSTIAVPLAPGIFVIHTEPNPLFSEGQAAPDHGLEALAEDGDPAALGLFLAAASGISSPLAPGIWWVHGQGEGLFVSGEIDAGLGLESLAEDGDPTPLMQSLLNTNSGSFGGSYGESPIPLQPGEAFLIEIEARPGDRLSFATMFIQSNDLFLAPGAAGIELFDADGGPISADVSDQVILWDAGTELNEAPGAGPNQAPRQAAAGVGEDEGGPVRPVDDGFVYPPPAQLLGVSIEPI